MTSKSKVGVSILGVVAVIAFALFGRMQDPDNANEREVLSATIEADARNPIALEKAHANEEDIEASLQCIGADGILQCGDYEGKQAAYYAALVGSIAKLRELKEMGVLDEQQNVALGVSASLGDLELIKAISSLLEQDQIDADIEQHPVFLAARFGHQKVVDYYLDLGFDPNLAISDGNVDVFVEAVLGGHEALALHVLDSGYRFDCVRRFPNGQTILGLLEANGMNRAVSRARESCET